jgi:lysozyme
MRNRALCVVFAFTGCLAFAVPAIAAPAPPSPSAPSSPSAPPPGYPVLGVDVSGWQHPKGAAIDWARVRAAGTGFATVKATEGSPADRTDYTNAHFIDDFEAARAQGLPVAPYHFYLGRTANTGAAQADYFIAELRRAGYTGHRANELPPILDFEWDWKGGCPPHGGVADARAWLTRVGAAFGRQPIIYTDARFVTRCLAGTAALGGYPLQVSDHDTGAGRPVLPAGWSTWSMWQWTAGGCVAGVPTCSLTRSVFNGTRSRLLSWANRRT